MILHEPPPNYAINHEHMIVDAPQYVILALNKQQQQIQE